MKSDQRTLSRPKRLLFQFVILLFIYGLTELCVFIYLGRTFYAIIEQRQAISRRDPITASIEFNYPMMLHPYVGIVYEPEKKAQETHSKELRVTEYGFFDNQPPLRKRDPGRVIVAIMGGSVARQLTVNASEILEQGLLNIPEFQDKTVDFVRLAIDGNKQPQQLMILNYLLMLEGEFDLVINLDGVNEIAIPEMDNVRYGVTPEFPRKWGAITAAAVSRDMMRLIGYQMYLSTSQRDFAARLNVSIIRYSPTVCWIWQVRNSQLETMQRQLYDRKDQMTPTEMTICSTGPRRNFESKDGLYHDCAEIWARSSEMINDLCRANRIKYFHFLQPNQYLAGSKPLGAGETSTAINDKSPFSQPVRSGYPIMREMAPRLRAAGVLFTDLTQVFADHPEPIYCDDCCHVIKDGDRIMAEAIVASIAEHYSQQDASRSSDER